MNDFQKTSSKKIDELEKLGYTDQFIFKEGNLIIPGKSAVFNHQDINIDKEFRFEGISNPDDMSILYAISTSKGIKGTIIVPYGTYGNREIAEFFLQVENYKE